MTRQHHKRLGRRSQSTSSPLAARTPRSARTPGASPNNRAGRLARAFPSLAPLLSGWSQRLQFAPRTLARGRQGLDRKPLAQSRIRTNSRFHLHHLGGCTQGRILCVPRARHLRLHLECESDTKRRVAGDLPRNNE